MTPASRRQACLALSLMTLITCVAAPLRGQDETRTPTAVALSVSRSLADAGQEVVVTAVVTAVGTPAPAPGGVVEFFSGPDALGTAQLSPADAGSTAAITVALPSGVHPLIARYRGTDVFAVSVSAPPVPLQVLDPPVER